jgi:hypothetical protein
MTRPAFNSDQSRIQSSVSLAQHSSLNGTHIKNVKPDREPNQRLAIKLKYQPALHSNPNPISTSTQRSGDLCTIAASLKTRSLGILGLGILP